MKKFFEYIAFGFVLITALSLLLISLRIDGLRAFIVSSGSMEPFIKTGSLIVTKYQNPSTLKKGNVITFTAPLKTHEIVTHRINGIIKKDNLITFKTKGDYNKNADNWILAEGGVIGKVFFIMPYFGYFLSIFQTKIGILIFIILPSVYIIYSEMGVIFSQFSTLAKVLLVLFFSIYCVRFSSALLSSSVTLASNKFSFSAPSPTPTCGGNTTVNISGNGDGSSNSVNVDNSCETIINQSNK